MCGVSQPRTSFFRRTRAKDGLQHRCKGCQYFGRRTKYRVVEQRGRRRYSRTDHGRFVHSQSIARRKHRDWDISFEEYTVMLEAGCTYCGGRLNVTSIGLDRLDNAGGYTIGNVVPACGRCNCMRGRVLTPRQMLQVGALLKKFDKEK